MNKHQLLKLQYLQEWQRRCRELESAWNAMESAVGRCDVSPLGEAVWKLFDAYTAQVAERVGDQHDWLVWYYTENNCGKAGKSVLLQGQPLEVRNLKNLLQVIEGSESCG